jgi:hypothetical protein
MAHLDFPRPGLWQQTEESQDQPFDSRFQNFMLKVTSAQNPGQAHSLRTFFPKPF